MSYVIVSIAANGVVHAWGKGDYDAPELFPTRSSAASVVRRNRRAEAREYPRIEPTRAVVCKLLGAS